MKKIVLVTGAAGGIGRILVEVLASANWDVIGSDHPMVKVDQCTRRQCIAWIPADLSILSRDSDNMEKFVMNVFMATCKSDISAIVHNAALQRLDNFEKLSINDWDETIAVNLMAPVAINKAFMDQLKRQKGSIVHIGSIHSQLTKPDFSAYATSKAALSGLTRAMAVELGDSIRVNAIEPAAVATPMLEAGFTNNEELRAKLAACHPTNSIGSPEDVAKAVLFLLDPLCSFLNGCILSLGGGIHSRLHDPE